MGSISLFIFFITLLVLARQVSPHYNSLNDVIVCLLHIFTFTPLKEFSFQLCSYITIALFTFFSVCLPFHHPLYLSKVFYFVYLFIFFMFSPIFSQFGLAIFPCTIVFVTINLVCWPVKVVDGIVSSSCFLHLLHTCHVSPVEGLHNPVISLTLSYLPRMNTIEFDVLRSSTARDYTRVSGVIVEYFPPVSLELALD